ncbi:rho hypothetical protein [Limosa lapponica baueri]|uniref:DH domain-containing protein n=1 Tax=Limosa lapponica baueri TaxID=1758121 RepID=A0A2I0T654_LIMLA|nr:rho hypothetical protein [Limosa lapponica baueri]
MRKHVIMTLLDTEQSYVESLRTLMQGYMKPLKQPENSLLCDPSLVDEIFDQIPELLEHHEQFLEQIHDCVQNWHEKQKVGDLLVQSFSKDVLVNIYSAYIDNFLNAKDAVRIAKEARPAFMKFLEKAVGGKKDRSFFLFTDLLVCTTLKRKSGSLRRSSMSLYTAASVIDTASKYKLLWKLPLEDVDIVKGASQATNRESVQKSICRLDEDLSTLGQVSKLSETLSFPHQNLDDVIKDLMAAIHRELAEKQSLSFSMAFPPNKVELSTTKADGTESFIFEFPNPDARLGFEQAFEDAKKKLGNTRDRVDTVVGLASCPRFCRPLFSITSSSSNLTFPSFQQKLPGPRIPQGHPHHEDAERDAGTWWLGSSIPGELQSSPSWWACRRDAERSCVIPE